MVENKRLARAILTGPAVPYFAERAAAAIPLSLFSLCLAVPTARASRPRPAGPEMKGRFLLQLRRNRVLEIHRRGVPT